MPWRIPWKWPAKPALKVTKKANEIVDNSFAENLEKSGFLKELWGGKLPN